MKDKNVNNIKIFWSDNPVGSNFIEYRQDESFYKNYDSFRYRTEDHILTELDRINLDGRIVLEIGLGQGADSMQLVNRGAIFHGIDLTEESVRRIKERFNLFNIPYEKIQVADAARVPYSDNYFDVVYSHGVIHHSPDIEKIVAEIYRVLKPGGRAVVMLYHKNSINYHISIALIRRLGLLVLWLIPSLTSVVSKLTGEGKERISRHITNLKREGLTYLSMRNFIHRSTDGPDNVYATVWTKISAGKLFSQFSNVTTRIHFLNERHLLGLQKLLSEKTKKSIARRWGWHLWIFGTK